MDVLVFDSGDGVNHKMKILLSLSCPVVVTVENEKNHTKRLPKKARQMRGVAGGGVARRNLASNF